MFFQRFFDDKLAQASYLIGCEATGEALVVDPNRDADQYLAVAKARGLRITHVTETHIHADFVSGVRELARVTGAAVYLSAEGGERWQYRFAEEDRARLLKDGAVIDVGALRIEARHTPGHAPEHLSFLVTDTPSADRPMGIFTGDFVFVGDVGRPDLLERAARVSGTMEAAARTLFVALQDFKRLPDYLQVWPGHGAGSACGKTLGAVPQSTVGYERRFNWALAVTDEDEFVRQVLAGQPDPPKYFGEMKRVNRDGPRVLGGLPRPPLVEAARLRDVLAADGVVIDTRTTAEHAAGHVPRTLNIPYNKSFTTRAGWVVPYGREVYLLVGESDGAGAAAAASAARDLALVGFDRLAGYFEPAAVAAWAAEGALEKIPQMNAGELAQRLAAGAGEAVTVVDVRDSAEWAAGHIAGAVHVPLGHLPDRAGELDRDRPLVVHCQSGGRSSIAASLLRSRGFTNVVNLSDGFAGWQRRGLPVERPAPAEEPAPRTPV